jgi:hypothetical protein
MTINFDVISDLNLSPDSNFNWETKPTSLYCIIAGNISSDLKVIASTIGHLSKIYQGVFYTPGSLEYENSTNFEKTTNDIIRAIRKYKNVAILHNHVVIIDGIALLGCNGWQTKKEIQDVEKLELMTSQLYDDIVYVKNSIEKLQKHLDIKKIVIISSAVPLNHLYYGEIPKHISGLPQLALALSTDSQCKVSNWVFGTQDKIVDTTIGNINYLNNGSFNKEPYWPKRIEVDI